MSQNAKMVSKVAEETEKPSQQAEAQQQHKLGHRRVDVNGEVSYKRVPTDEIIGALQLGLRTLLIREDPFANKALRDVSGEDFRSFKSFYFPRGGSRINDTPSHEYSDFFFKTFAGVAFSRLRKLFNIQPGDFLSSLCSAPLKELSNPGASGSIFYLSANDQFIIKTVSLEEGNFLIKILPKYYTYLVDEPNTLLPKFFGLFCYETIDGKNIRLLVMNNLFPQSIELHHKFDLKGSTYGRCASQEERKKQNPTYKDLDFNEEFKDGIILRSNVYEVIMDIIDRDCLLLESLNIMDYSLIVGIHKIQIEQDENSNAISCSNAYHKKFDMLKFSKLDFNDQGHGGICAKSPSGENLLIFLGIIDILQSYTFFKMIERCWKNIIYNGENFSVADPRHYNNRFRKYISTNVLHQDVNTALSDQACNQQSDGALEESVFIENTENNSL